MTREQILRAYLEGEMLVEKGYLKEGQGEKARWMDTQHNTMVQVLKLAIEGVFNNDNQTTLTRKVNLLLDKTGKE